MIEYLRNTSPTFHKGATIAAIGLSIVAIRWAPLPLKLVAAAVCALALRHLYFLQQKPLILLSCSGGGSRAVYTLEVLRLLESQSRRPLHEAIDLFAGTSAGVFSAAGIAIGRKAADILRIFEEKLPKVFPNNLARNIETGWGFFATRFTAEGLNEVITGLIGTKTLSAISKYFLIPASVKDNTLNNIYFVRSHQGVGILKGNGQGFIAADVPLHVAMRATTAAETYLPSEPIKVLDNLEAVDGGTATNLTTPVAQAVTYFRGLFPHRRIRVISVGTGYVDHDWEGSKDWGLEQYLENGKIFSLQQRSSMSSELDKVRNLGMELVHFDVAMPKEIPLDDTSLRTMTLLKQWANETPQRQAADWQTALSWLK